MTETDFTPVTKEESIAFNNFIGDLEDNAELCVGPGGKAVAYIGWYWRSVDFTKPFNLGVCFCQPSMFEGPGNFVGFMENNKWDYVEYTVTQEQYQEIITALRKLREDPTISEVLGVNLLLEKSRPKDWRKTHEQRQEELRELEEEIERSKTQGC